MRDSRSIHNRFRRFFRSLAWMAVLCLFLFPSQAFGGWVIQGNAYLNGSEVVLTPNLNDQVGAAWMDSQIDLARDFTATYTMRLSRASNDPGADGISFCLQRDSSGSGTLGSTTGGGEWIGTNGIYPAIAVEVDTYQNTIRNDPSADHIAVNEYPSSGSGLPNHAGASPVTARSDGANIEDGADHVLRVVWTAATRTMLIYFDNSLRITYTRDFVTNIFGGNTVVWWGFTASTGGMTNYQSIIPSTPLVSVIKPVSPISVAPGGSVTYEIRITNNGTSTIWVSRITDTMPAAFSYTTGSTTGITTADPSQSGQTLTWNLSGYAVQPGTTESLFFANTVPSEPGDYCNTFTVSGPNFPTQSGSCESTLLVRPPTDLSIAKNHVGFFTVGSTGSYTLVVTNNGAEDAAYPVTVTDTLPSGMAYHSSSGSGWIVDASASPVITWTYSGIAPAGVTLPPITLNVAVGSGAVPSVTNTASVASAVTPDMDLANNTDTDLTTVIGSGSGNKPLYLKAGAALSRAPNTTAPSNVTIAKNGVSSSWTLTPVTTGNITLTAGTIPVHLLLSSNAAANRTITVTLTTIGSTAVTLGSIGPASYALTTTPTERVFSINLASNQTLDAGTQVVLTVTNGTTGSGTRNVIVTPNTGLAGSRVSLTASTVIDITSIGFYDAGYPDGNLRTTFTPGSRVYVRATVSDPFGYDDISGASLDIVDPSNTTRVPGEAMTEAVFDAGTRTYEYEYVVPEGADGDWTCRVRASEGQEGLVNDVAEATFTVGGPHLVILKTLQTVFDPVNQFETDAKAIPGARLQYAIVVTNQGAGTVDADTVRITDRIPDHTKLYVGDINGPGSGPVRFENGPTLSGLTFTAGTDVTFSNDEGDSYGYPPAPDGDDCDPDITHLQINPKGIFNGAGPGGIPSFTVYFQVVVE